MILSQRKSDPEHVFRVKLKNETYLIVNIFFVGLILLIIAYSVIFSPDRNKYPVTCINEQITGVKCLSCGLSHSFSLIVRGRIEEANRWNSNGLNVFIFFTAQLMFRIVFSVFYVFYQGTRKQLILFDCIGSGIIFLVAFWPFITGIIKYPFG